MSRNEPYRVHEQVWVEIEEADEWYSARSLDASLRFLIDIDDAFDRVSLSPARWPKYLYGTRRLVLQRFPFSVVYLDDPGMVNIVAVAHGKRKPGYWKQRI